MSTPANQARAIFVEAIEQPDAGERAKFIAHACGGDAELQACVERLVQSHEQLGSFHENPPPEGATLDQPAARPGTQIGPYKLLQQIGEGGMGVVYMAEQTEPIARRVALKIVKPGMDSRQVIARFEAERQALSLMDHPNIAKVLDAGEVGQASSLPEQWQAGSLPHSGRPYFVMELVKGQPITQYCDEHHLTPRQRLELFVPVCQAIQHAHQKGIIHRDIKPTNILVAEYDQKAVPKVIDFGVAKAISQALTEKTMFTGLGQIVGTLEYMSPEQAKVNQLDIDTRSDIYSLGVLMYELLTGSTPFDKARLRLAGWDEMLRIIREEEPPKPSTRLSSAETLPSIAANRSMEPARLGRTVRGELDWIVMKALEKDRNRRYDSANGLAADIQRYLSDEPVIACPPSGAYRLTKFLRRNKGRLAITGVVAAALLISVSGIGWAVRDQAARQAAVDQEVNLALKEAERLQEQSKWPDALSAAKRAEGLLAGSGSNEFRERIQQLRKDIEMVLRLEEIRLLRSQWKDHKLDRESADQAYALAFVTYGIDVTGLPAEAAARIRARPLVAEALVAALDEWTNARRRKDESGAMALQAVAEAAESDPWRRHVREAANQEDGKALAALAASPEILRQPPTSLEMLAGTLHHLGLVDVGIDLRRRAQRQYPGDFWINYGLAGDLVHMGPSHHDEAVSFYRAAVPARPNSSAALNDLARALGKQGKLDEAVAICRKAVEIDPNNAIAHGNIGFYLGQQGKPDEAIFWSRKAMAIDPKYASAHNILGNALADQGKLAEAIDSFHRAIELDSSHVHAHLNLGNVLLHSAKFEDAAASYRKAYAIDPGRAAAYGLGLALWKQRKLDGAIEWYGKALAIDPKDVKAAHGLGLALREKGELDGAIEWYRKCLGIDPKYVKAQEVRDKLGQALNDRAWDLATNPDLNRRDGPRAVELAKQAVELAPKAASFWNTLGVANVRAGNWREAITGLQKFRELRTDDAEWTNPFFLAMAHWQLREKDEARKWFDKGVEWMDRKNVRTGMLPRLRAEAAELLGIEQNKESEVTEPI